MTVLVSTTISLRLEESFLVNLGIVYISICRLYQQKKVIALTINACQKNVVF